MDASADAPSLAQAPSKDGTLPPSPAPRWTWQPKVHALAVEGGVDRPRWDGALAVEGWRDLGRRGCRPVDARSEGAG